MTMLEEFAKRLNASKAREGLKPWDSKTNHIWYVPWFRIQSSYTNKYFLSCLAHVINLATQAFIAGYSKTKYFDPEKPDDHNPDIDAPDRDVVGLVRAITVKVMSKFHCTGMYWQWLIGPFIRKAQATFQNLARWSDSTPKGVAPWYESSMVIDSCYDATRIWSKSCVWFRCYPTTYILNSM